MPTLGFPFFARAHFSLLICLLYAVPCDCTGIIVALVFVGRWLPSVIVSGVNRTILSNDGQSIFLLCMETFLDTFCSIFVVIPPPVESLCNRRSRFDQTAIAIDIDR